eukprot:12611433-Heterocapsa_arctica.AAC.1
MEHMEEGENMNDIDFSRASAGGHNIEDKTLRALSAQGGAAILVRKRRMTESGSIERTTYLIALEKIGRKTYPRGTMAIKKIPLIATAY